MHATSHLHMARHGLTAKAVLAAIVLITGFLSAGCGAGAPTSIATPSASPTATLIPAFDGLVIDIVANGQVFSKAELEVPAGVPFRILLDNQDTRTAHGVAIAVGDTPALAREAEAIYKGPILQGPGIQAYDVPALAVGTYWFFCQPHASMNGTITVK